jgi:hypothetical protein
MAALPSGTSGAATRPLLRLALPALAGHFDLASRLTFRLFVGRSF